MSILLFKSLLSALSTLISILINYFLLYKKTKRKFIYIALICTILNLLYFTLDFFLYNNLIIDYIAFILLHSFLLSISFEDIRTKLIDNRVITGYFISFLVFRIIFLNFAIFIEGILGFVSCLIIMTVAYFFKKDSMGIGDIETISACGLIIGFPNIFHFLFKAFLFVFIYGCYLYIKSRFITNKNSKKNLHDEIPLAPFLLLATII